MPKIPTLVRQQALPSSTGVQSPTVVPIQDHMGQALQAIGQTSMAIGEDLNNIKVTSEITQAVTNATLKLSNLEATLEKEDGFSAKALYDGKAGEIYTDATKALSHPESWKQFDQKWKALSGKSKISVNAAATKRIFLQAEADLEITLNAYTKGIAPNGDHIALDMAQTNGTVAIYDLARSGAITQKAAAKRAIKFRKEIAENAVVGWLNRQTTGTMTQALFQMDHEKFADEKVQAFWNELDEDKKSTLTSRAITNISRSLSFSDKKTARENAALKADGKGLMLEFYKPDTSDERREEILTKLSRNKTIEVGTYNTMLKDSQGRTDRFDDTTKSTQLKLRILRTPHLVTDEEIIKSGLSDVDALLTMRNAKLDDRTKRAKAIITSSPAFVPANPAEARLKGDAFDAAQADIWNQVLIEQTEARDEGKSFDPVGRAKQLIKEFAGEADTGAAKAEALGQLKTLGIHKAEDVDVYINQQLSAGSPLSPSAINNLRALAGKAF